MKNEATRDQVRIASAAMGMVYGAGIMTKLTTGKASEITLERVADYLEELAANVRKAGDRARENEEVLSTLRSQRRTVGEFLRDALKAVS